MAENILVSVTPGEVKTIVKKVADEVLGNFQVCLKVHSKWQSKQNYQENQVHEGKSFSLYFNFSQQYLQCKKVLGVLLCQYHVENVLSICLSISLRTLQVCEHRSFWLLYCYAKAVSMSYLLKAEVEARLKDREMVLAGKIGKLQTR